MDRRLLLEFLPGIVFLLVNAISTLFIATAMAIVAACVAVALRYRIDGQIPFIAVATVVLSVVLLAVGFASGPPHHACLHTELEVEASRQIRKWCLQPRGTTHHRAQDLTENGGQAS